MQPTATLKGFGVTFKQIFKKPITQQYPEYKRPVYPRFPKFLRPIRQVTLPAGFFIIAPRPRQAIDRLCCDICLGGQRPA